METVARPRIFQRIASAAGLLMALPMLGSVPAHGQTVTRFTYDANDNVVSVTDPRGHVTTYTYDGLGQKWQQTSPDTATTTYSYDVYGRLASMTPAGSNQVSYGYDGISRRTSITAGTATQAFTYDTCTSGKGRLCTVSDANSNTTYAYSPEGWVTGRGFAVGGTSYSLGYSYNALGQITAVAYPDGNQALYAYTNGVVSAVQVKVNGAVSNVATSIGYQPNDLAMTQWTSSNGLTNTLSYDTDGRLIGIAVPGIQSLGFSYDSANRIVGIANGIDGAMTQTFGYDAMSRLASVRSDADNEDLAYDANGNRTSQTLNGAGVAVTTNGGNNQITQLSGASNTSYTYDPRGNLTTVNGTTSFSYDVFNRMSAAGSATYVVNPEGQRLSKTVNGVAAYFAPDRAGSLLAEYPGDGWSDYIWLNGRLIARVSAGQILAVHDDQTGRPEVMTYANQAIAWRARNFAFDRAVIVASTVPLNLGFPGQYYDAESGLWNNGFRDYSSNLGRYIESDPMGLVAGINTYAYVGAQPISNTDLRGLEMGVAYQALFRASGGVPNTQPVRMPDVYQFEVGRGPITVSAVFTRYGDAFVGLSLNPTEIAKGGKPQVGGVAIAVGYLMNCDYSRDTLNGVIKGISGGASFYYGAGGGFATNDSGTIVLGGVGAGQFSYGSGYTKYTGNIFTGTE